MFSHFVKNNLYLFQKSKKILSHFEKVYGPNKRPPWGPTNDQLQYSSRWLWGWEPCGWLQSLDTRHKSMWLKWFWHTRKSTIYLFNYLRIFIKQLFRYLFKKYIYIYQWYNLSTPKELNIQHVSVRMLVAKAGELAPAYLMENEIGLVQESYWPYEGQPFLGGPNNCQKWQNRCDLRNPGRFFQPVLRRRSSWKLAVTWAFMSSTCRATTGNHWFSVLKSCQVEIPHDFSGEVREGFVSGDLFVHHHHFFGMFFFFFFRRLGKSTIW